MVKISADEYFLCVGYIDNTSLVFTSTEIVSVHIVIYYTFNRCREKDSSHSYTVTLTYPDQFAAVSFAWAGRAPHYQTDMTWTCTPLWFEYQITNVCYLRNRQTRICIKQISHWKRHYGSEMVLALWRSDSISSMVNNTIYWSVCQFFYAFSHTKFGNQWVWPNTKYLPDKRRLVFMQHFKIKAKAFYRCI